MSDITACSASPEGIVDKIKEVCKTKREVDLEIFEKELYIETRIKFVQSWKEGLKGVSMNNNKLVEYLDLAPAGQPKPQEKEVSPAAREAWLERRRIHAAELFKRPNWQEAAEGRTVSVAWEKWQERCQGGKPPPSYVVNSGPPPNYHQVKPVPLADPVSTTKLTKEAMNRLHRLNESVKTSQSAEYILEPRLRRA